jgi:MFS family permease
MSKASITRMWIAGLIVLVVGLAVGGISLGLMLAKGGTWVPAASGNGSDFIPTVNGFFWTTVGFMIAGFTIAAVGGIVQLATWIGALVNTYQFEDKAWFIILLVGGLLGLAFGLISFAVMVAYLVAGPDGMPAGRPRPHMEQMLQQTRPMPPNMPPNIAPIAPQPAAPQTLDYAHMR